ncbi:aldo/keto reductase [Streptomyces sp. NPDC051546]|uniref:aldo/keto reductase n=1 Tax=Streptomyces sp. NPDC051546 TaxID=3365655 RepID=UPI0037B9D7C8
MERYSFAKTKKNHATTCTEGRTLLRLRAEAVDRGVQEAADLGGARRAVRRTPQAAEQHDDVHGVDALPVDLEDQGSPDGGGLSRKAIMSEIDHSLRRLGTEYVDVYMIHRLDGDTPLEETLEALNDVVKAGKARCLGASSMHAWEFAKALHLQERHGWARFVTMQDHYNLLAREEEREMLPLCADEGVATMVWSPLARGRPARPFDQADAGDRAATDGGYDDLLYKANAASDRRIIDEAGTIADARGVSRAQVSPAWLRRNPVVAAPLVGARTIERIDAAVASLDLDLTDEEARRLEAPYTPRHDFQGVSDPAEPERIKAAIPGYANV